MVFQVRLVLEYVRAGKINLTPDCLECSHIWFRYPSGKGRAPTQPRNHETGIIGKYKVLVCLKSNANAYYRFVLCLTACLCWSLEGSGQSSIHRFAVFLLLSRNWCELDSNDQIQIDCISSATMWLLWLCWDLWWSLPITWTSLSTNSTR